MKTILLIATFLMFVSGTVAQKQNVVLIAESKPKSDIIIFKIEKENFRFIAGIHDNKKISLNGISKEIVSIHELKSLTKQRMKKDGIRDSFIQAYFEKYFSLSVFVKNTECQNKGTLYEVEWILSITEPEID